MDAACTDYYGSEAKRLVLRVACMGIFSDVWKQFCWRCNHLTQTMVVCGWLITKYGCGYWRALKYTATYSLFGLRMWVLQW